MLIMRIGALDSLNARGYYTKKLNAKDGLRNLTNKKNPTFLNPASKTMLTQDLGLVKNDTRQFVKKFKVGGDVGSDHLPLLLEVNFEAICHKIYRRKHWLYDKCNKSKYKEYIDLNINQWMKRWSKSCQKDFDLMNKKLDQN